ncbi:MAG TPA: hypothetical protein VMD25_02760 [Acidobacteriaceae bacterium]|nr:hypothetical protein [Acidobacteriaceae bacterium]
MTQIRFASFPGLFGILFIAAMGFSLTPAALIAQSTTTVAALPDAPDASSQQNPTQQTAPPAPSSTSSSPQSAPPSTSGQDKSAQTSGQGKVAGTSNNRLFYALPNFLTMQGGKLPPLTAGQKFKVVALGDFDPVQYPWWGLLAAIGQADNSDPAYGQGWVAYAKRYGTTAGDSTVENFMVGAVFPSILHQDPRFYQSSSGGYAHRAFYAVSRIVVTRSDSGHSQFNYSEIFGAAVAGAISTYSYHPRSTYISTPTNPHLFVPSERTLGNTADTWGTQVGLDTITIVIKEFWPDVQHKLSHKSRQGSAGGTGSSGGSGNPQ